MSLSKFMDRNFLFLVGAENKWRMVRQLIKSLVKNIIGSSALNS
jgi:hypothetical protein